MNDILWLLRHRIDTAPATPFSSAGLDPSAATIASNLAARRAAEALAASIEGVDRPRLLIAALQQASDQLSAEAIQSTEPAQERALGAQADALALLGFDLLAPGAPRRSANRTLRELILDHLNRTADLDAGDIDRIKLRLDDPELLVAARAGWFDTKTPRNRLNRALVHFMPIAV